MQLGDFLSEIVTANEKSDENFSNKWDSSTIQQQIMNGTYRADAIRIWEVGNAIGLTTEEEEEQIVNMLVSLHDGPCGISNAVQESCGNRAKCRDIRELIRGHGVEFCCIQETNKEIVDEIVGRSMWGTTILDGHIVKQRLLAYVWGGDC
ncbi:hypothetical protein ACS0TY_030196 [Phlomoides rotata]